MLRTSRKRTRNKFAVRKAPADKTTDIASLSTNDTVKGIQPSSASVSSAETNNPVTTATDTSGPVTVTEGDNSGEIPCSRVVQSASSSPKRFRSSSSIPNRSVSPARFYREKEQSELQSLNDRLFSHVETVKRLQSENASLRLQLEGLEIFRSEKDARKHFHQSDIETLQDLLDASRQESNTLEQVLQVTRKERDSLRQSLVEKEEDLALLDIRVENLKATSQQCGRLESEMKSMKETLKEREADAKRLSEDMVKEKMCRKRLEEEAQMNKGRYMKEIEEASARMNRHMETTDQKLEAGYEVLVNDALTGVREQNARDLAALKEELTAIYQTKLSDWKSKAERSNADLISTKKELKASRTEMDALRARNTRLKMDAAAFKVQIEEDQTKLTEVKNECEREACQLQREMVILKQELCEVKDELEEMGGANMRLEREIATYRVLLDDLDTKSPFGKRVKEDGRKDQKESPGSAKKEDNTGPEFGQNQDVYLRTNEMDKGICIGTVDADGRYLSVANRADHLVDLCLWTIVQSSYNKRLKFEIPYSTPIMSDQRLYIWADGEGPFKDRPGYDQIMSLPDDVDTRHFYRINTTAVRPSAAAAAAAAAARNSRHGRYNNNNNKTHLDSSNSSGNHDTTITDGNINDPRSELTGIDAIHISMRGKRWLRKPQSMNIRLEDGDSQLQAKCDLTTISKLRGFEPYASGVDSGKQAGKPASLYVERSGAGYGGQGASKESGTQPAQSYDPSAVRMGKESPCNKADALSKDGCVTM